MTIDLSDVRVTLRQAGVHRDIRHIDHAIEEHIEGHMLAFLDLTPTEWAAWAAYEATA